MPDHRIKAVVFDLGETLLTFGRVDTHKLFRQAARLTYDFLRECGQDLPNFRLYEWHNFFFSAMAVLAFKLVGKGLRFAGADKKNKSQVRRRTQRRAVERACAALV